MKHRLLLLGLCACVLACDSANPIAPTGTVLSASANPSQIGLNGQSTITVTGFKPDGNRLNPGTQIILSTSLGNLYHPTSGQQISIVEIDGSGQAGVILRADGRAGSATIAATLSTSGGGSSGGEGGSTSGASASVTVQIGQTAEDQPTLTLTANPEAINPNGKSTITALARAADGSPLAGAAVAVRTSLGELNKTSDTTGADGNVDFTLTAGSQTGDAVVTGSVGSSAEVTVTVAIGQPSLLINANPSTVDVGDTSDITVTARGANGTPLVNRELLLTADLGTLDDVSPTTDSTGRAFAVFTAGSRAGTGTVDAILGSSDQVSVSISIRDAPTTVTLEVDPNQFTPSQEGAVLDLTVRVLNADGLGLANEVVSFVIDPTTVTSTLDPAGGPTTDSNGRATATMTFTDADIPDGVTGFTITAVVRNIESEPQPVTVQ